MAARKNTHYSSDLKMQAVHAFLEEGMTRREVVERYDIASISTFKKWVIAYKREGSQALDPKPIGRPRGQKVPVSQKPPDAELAWAEAARLKRKLGV